MKTLTNRAGTYSTGDEIADAVMDYSGALAEERRTEVVDIPFVATSGVIRRVQILIGWRVEVNSVHHGGSPRELVDEELSGMLRRKAEAVRSPSGDTPFTDDDIARFFGASDY
ncbi:hypothetical protein [Microbacterium sulfonylureivorans]|uniref:hypothetical protein n=1 Tax=Microbacterium sulfonylureivorans TaxID=2486854 RepID=UPI000FD9EF9C|nr:hypothetical protein [Microbacterium sulfonylureivorans]